MHSRLGCPCRPLTNRRWFRAGVAEEKETRAPHKQLGGETKWLKVAAAAPIFARGLSIHTLT